MQSSAAICTASSLDPGVMAKRKHIAASPWSEQVNASSIFSSQAQSAMHSFSCEEQPRAMHDQQSPMAVPGA